MPTAIILPSGLAIKMIFTLQMASLLQPFQAELVTMRVTEQIDALE